MSPGERYNHFVGLKVPWPEGLDDLLADAPKDLRPLAPPDLHLTVAFLGPMDPTLTDRLLDAVGAVRFNPVEVRLGRLVPLPHRRRPSAFSFELDLGERFISALIQEQKETLVRLAGGRPDERPPYPHITIGRPPRRAEPSAIERLVAWADRQRPPTQEVLLSELLLYRSRPNNARLYEVLGP